jgi:hypothetical protein
VQDGLQQRFILNNEYDGHIGQDFPLPGASLRPWVGNATTDEMFKSEHKNSLPIALCANFCDWASENA